MVSGSSVIGLGVHTGWWMYDNITPIRSVKAFATIASDR